MLPFLLSLGFTPFELLALWLVVDEWRIGHHPASYFFGSLAAFFFLLYLLLWIETVSTRLYFDKGWVGLSSLLQNKRCRLEDLRDVRFAYYSGIPLYAFWRRDGKLAWNQTSYGWSRQAIKKFAGDLGVPFVRVPFGGT
jgi:hypothetical protein